MTQRNFEIALEKGYVGEMLARRMLEAKGWSVFMPVTEGAHHFDMMATLNKQRAIALDVKSKARMNKYHATGVNRKHFDDYVRFSERHLMPFWIVFVDEFDGTVYGNEIKSLEHNIRDSVDDMMYPRDMTIGSGTVVRLWSLDVMLPFGTVDGATVSKLRGASQRSYDYEIQA